MNRAAAINRVPSGFLIVACHYRQKSAQPLNILFLFSFFLFFPFLFFFFLFFSLFFFPFRIRRKRGGLRRHLSGLRPASLKVYLRLRHVCWIIFQEFSEKFPGNFREFSEKFPRKFRESSGKFPRKFREISGKFPGNFRELGLGLGFRMVPATEG